METSLTRIIVKQDNISQKKQDVQAKTRPTIPSDLQGWSSPLWVIIVNKTQFDVTYVDKFFNHGTFHGESPAANPWDVTAFGMRNTTTFLGMGFRLGGAISFSVLLDESHTFDFSVGFENPLAGSYAASVIKGHDRQAAYKKACDERSGNTITSDKYSGKNDDDDIERFKLNLSATPGETMTISISQDPL